MRAEVGPAFTTGAELRLVEGDNLESGASELASEFGGDLTSLESDLLRLGAAVFLTDLAFRREVRERYGRAIELRVPVVNHAILEPRRQDFVAALRLLSRDTWRLEFVRAPGTPEPLSAWPDIEGSTLLFSGGLDSLAAGIKFALEGTPLVLVSHQTGNTKTRKSQAHLRDAIAALDPSVRHIAAAIGPRSGAEAFPDDKDRESSQRTRSFLFVILAAIVARRTGHRNIVTMAENGPIAIHLALSPARLGPFSTHTAHPEYLALMQDCLTSVLGVGLTVANPFLYATKGEVVAELVRSFPDLIPQSISCWSSARHPIPHCGECVPCFVRRFALEANGYPTEIYEKGDLFKSDLDALPPDHEGLRNLDDLLTFASSWSSGKSAAELCDEYLELWNTSLDQEQAVSLYQRFANEIVDVAGGYPNLRKRLS